MKDYRTDSFRRTTGLPLFAANGFHYSQAKGYHDHPKPESKTPSELRKVTASYKRKLVEKRRTKTAVLSRLRADTEREELFRFQSGTAGGGGGGAPLAAGAELEVSSFPPEQGREFLLPAGDCSTMFKCSGRKLSYYYLPKF